MRFSQAELLETVNVPVVEKPDLVVLNYLHELTPNVIDIKTLRTDFVEPQFGYTSHEKTRQMCLRLSIAGYIKLKKYGKHIMLLPIKKHKIRDVGK